MKKYFKWVAVAAVVGAVALVNVKVALNANSTNEWLSSLLTFTENGDSNNEGSGMFFYKHLLGHPKTCTLYKYISINGDVSYSTEDGDLGINYTKIQVQGMYEECPDKGSGCTVYSCQETN